MLRSAPLCSCCVPELPECAALGCLQNSRCQEDAATGRLRCGCLHGYQASSQHCLRESGRC